MATEPLQNLTEQSAGVGEWMLQIAGVPKDSEYEWAKGSKAGKGRKLVLLLVSEDSSKYCMGVYKRLGKEPKATDQFEAAKKSTQTEVSGKHLRYLLRKRVQSTWAVPASSSST